MKKLLFLLLCIFYIYTSFHSIYAQERDWWNSSEYYTSEWIQTGYELNGVRKWRETFQQISTELIQYAKDNSISGNTILDTHWENNSHVYYNIAKIQGVIIDLLTQHWTELIPDWHDNTYYQAHVTTNFNKTFWYMEIYIQGQFAWSFLLSYYKNTDNNDLLKEIEDDWKYTQVRNYSGYDTVFGISIAKAVATYIKENKINTPESVQEHLRNIQELVGQTIVDHWWWDGQEWWKNLKWQEKEDLLNSAVRFDGTTLIIGCGNTDTGRFRLKTQNNNKNYNNNSQQENGNKDENKKTKVIHTNPPSPVGSGDNWECREQDVQVEKKVKVETLNADGEKIITWETVIETKKETVCECLPTSWTYATYTTWPWSACNVGSNSWSGNSIACIQTRSVTQNINNCTYGCGTTCPTSQEIPIDEKTGNVTIPATSSGSISYSSSPFADGSSALTLTLRVNTPAEWVDWNGRIFSDFKDTTVIRTNRINNSGDEAISMTGSVNNNTITIQAVSIAPVKQIGTLSFQEGSKVFNISGVQYFFKKPFTATLQVQDVDGSWNGKSTLGTRQKYRISPKAQSSLSASHISSYALSRLKPSIQHFGDNIILKDTNIESWTLSAFSGTTFSTRIDSSANATTLNTSPQVAIQNAVISYIFNGKNISYYLSDRNDDFSINRIISPNSDDFLWVKIEGTLQWTGKQAFTGQKENYSAVNISNEKHTIRRNAFDTIKTMKSKDTVQRVKYVEWDFYISRDMDFLAKKYDVLIVKDGNVIITDNIDTGSLFWIIALKDNFNVGTDYKSSGNIYITPEVTKIHAIIYSDWWIISTDKYGNVFETDSDDRTKILRNQLIFKGSLFSKNTIGWATYVGWYYSLPWGKQTQDFDTALLYDLNYTRRGNIWCKTDTSGKCITKEPFIIQYDPRIITSKLPIFTK